MEYDEKYFKKSANRLAEMLWVILNMILTVAYAIEVTKGGRTAILYCLSVPLLDSFYFWSDYVES